jgi:rRNA maturation protein Nop10
VRDLPELRLCQTCHGIGMVEVCPVCGLNREAPKTKECPEGFHHMRYWTQKGARGVERYVA